MGVILEPPYPVCGGDNLRTPLCSRMNYDVCNTVHIPDNKADISGMEGVRLTGGVAVI